MRSTRPTPATVPPVQVEVQEVLDRADGREARMVGVERFAFYDKARTAYAVIQTGERRFYGCFTLRKGVSDTELAELYASASALVFPSLSEGFGLPAAEALAVGCPVLHWQGCAAVAEIVVDDGVAIPEADDADLWRTAMLAAEAGEVAASGSDRIRQRYSWESVAARVDEQIALV